MTLGEMLRRARAHMTSAGVATPGLDARVLISGLLGLDAARMILAESHALDPADEAMIEAGLRRRLDGEPVYRILGMRAFCGLDLGLSPATLEPRPDTEVLVEAVLPFMSKHVERAGRCRIADMGTGSGAVGLALLAACPQAQCLGVDVSEAALETAAQNARRNGLESRFETLRSDWFEKISGRFDAIVANPPYIETRRIETLAPEVRDHDPHLALDGGEDGLDAYRIIAGRASGHLRGPKIVAVEYGFDQADCVADIFQASGFGAVSRHRDLCGRERAGLFAPEHSENDIEHSIE